MPKPHPASKIFSPWAGNEISENSHLGTFLSRCRKATIYLLGP